MNHIQIPYEDLKIVNKPYFNQLEYISKNIIENGWYILGENVLKFEESFGKIHSNSYCLGVASGLDALILGLSVFDFPPNSKVLVPSNAYIASILSILRAGLIPILVEPDPKTYNITYDELEKKYDKDCVAILPVHMYGRISPMLEILDFANHKNLRIIEDCAQSHFSELNNIKAGEFGDIGAFSFYPTKNLGAFGDAGAIICKDKEIYLKLKALRNYGSEIKYHNKYIGVNSRLDELQAIFLNIKLPFLDKINNHKNTLANAYNLGILNDKIIKPTITQNSKSVYHIYNIRTKNRDNLRDYLLEYGIQTEIHYPIAPHLQEGYSKLFINKSYPISESIHKTTLSLPISYANTLSEINYIIEKINNF